MTQRAMLCPKCRKIIGSTEITCSWCGFSRSRPHWTSMIWRQKALDGDWLVRAIITANISFYLFSLLFSPRSGGMNPFSLFSPDQSSLMLLGGTGTVPVIRLGRVWSLLSANYLHGGILHLLFNLSALRQIAPWVSHEYGPSRMFIIYTIGGIIGFLISVMAGVPFTIGASAAVCGLIGSLLYYGKSRGGSYGAAVYSEVSGWVVGLFLFGLLIPGINNWGHGGGILGGMLIGMLLGYQERTRETGFHRLLALGCAVLTVAILGWGFISALLIWMNS